MFRGSSAQIKLRTKQPSRYYRPKSAKQAWQSSTNYLSPNVLSRLVSLRLGRRIIVRPYNVFSYLSNKLGKLTYKNHQTHVWGKYHKQKKYFHSYYDLVNSLFVLAYIPFSERLVIAIIQYALIRMHRRKVKPKRLFVLIDQIINEMPVIRQNFHACRVVITGKVKGGKARTSSLSAGFGVLPKQSLTENIRFDFGDVRSKYGAFGVNMLT